MTLFEYLSIAYSLVFSFAVIRLVAGLPHAIDPSRRYWIHVVHVCLGIFAALALFWAHWSTREVAWSFPAFLVNLAGPGMIYFLSCTLVPDEPSSVQSWHDYFFSARRKYFGGLCIWAVIMAVNTTIFFGASPLHPLRVIQVGLLGVGLAGLASDRPATHRLILTGVAVVAIIAAVVLLRPGTLAERRASAPGGFTTLHRIVVPHANDLELVMGLVDRPGESNSPKHHHPGGEFGFILEGAVTVTTESQPRTLLRAGDSFYQAAREWHVVSTAAEGARTVVFRLLRKGEPMIVEID
jgi:quercetin dioxygenase-like cupin family protein